MNDAEKSNFFGRLEEARETMTLLLNLLGPRQYIFEVYAILQSSVWFIEDADPPEEASVLRALVRCATVGWDTSKPKAIFMVFERCPCPEPLAKGIRKTWMFLRELGLALDEQKSPAHNAIEETVLFLQDLFHFLKLANDTLVLDVNEGV